MRKLPLFLVTCLAMLGFVIKPDKARASHAAGAEIVYEYVSGNTYRFILKFYRDCDGTPPIAPSYNLCFYNHCTASKFNVQADLYTGLIPNTNPALPPVPNGTPVSAGCSDALTKCDDPNSIIKGYQEWWYVCSQDLDDTCDSWRISFSENARNTGQTNIPDGLNLYVETTYDNDYAPFNSSPYFAVKPIPFCCENKPFQYNNAASDPDGDSLSHQMMLPLINGPDECDQPQVAVTPTGGFTPTINPVNNPLPTGGTFSISATTGQMAFTPNMAGTATITELVKEWRNGHLIGTIMRDMQVQVIPAGDCSSVPVVLNTNFGTPTGGKYVTDHYEGCVEQNLSFTFNATSTAPDARLIFVDNHTAPRVFPSGGADVSVTYTGQRTPNVTGTFSWTPGPTDYGWYDLLIGLIDSTCRPPGLLYNNYQIVRIFIWPPTEAFKDTAICPGDMASLAAQGGSDFTWSVLSGSAGSVNPTTGANVSATPAVTTKYRVVSNATLFCPRHDDTVTVTALPVPQFIPMVDKTTCPGTSLILDPQVTQTPGVTYTLNWSPATYLSAITGMTVVATPGDDITYTVVITASNSICRGYDTVALDVLDGFTILTGDTAICVGGKVPIRATGDVRYDYQWSTLDDPGANGVFDDATKLTTVITPSATPPYTKHTYTLTASYAGCPKDSVSDITIDVQPIPDVTVDEDTRICYGDTMLMHPIITPPYTGYIYKWTPGLAMDNPNIPGAIFSALNVGETELTLTVSTTAGCKDEDKVKLTVLPADFIFVSNDTAICPGDTTQLNMTGVGLQSFSWAASGDINDVHSANPYVYPLTTTDYVIYGRDTNTCYDTQMVHIVVRPAPVVSLPDSIVLFPGQSYPMNPVGNAMYYSWFPPVGLSAANIANPVASPLVNTRYIVTATTEANCSVIDSIDIIISPESLIDMPNAFAPNGRNLLKPSHLGAVQLVNFTIFNRWGAKVYESSDINDGWDGKYNNEPQPMGVYIYTIDAVTPTGKRFNKQGNITVIR
ncbi:MAG: gliding motility-associated C-terminal domain-containing protein [Sphingobacteriales bacterium]|nr:MAG: gliding motility-associated C-terminal domain-containing protein [Sphingobacteriales bacterium]